MEKEATNSNVYSYYLDFLDRGDPRVSKWLWMDSPLPTLAILIVYMLALKGINSYLKERIAFNLKWLLVAYNFAQVLGSFYVFSETLTVAILSNYSMTCEPVDYTTNPLPMRMASVIWWFYFSKAVDLFDTIFFALRKKSNQITFLHVFHHLTMFPYAWIVTKYVAGGQMFFLTAFNSFVHTIMYSYYALSALGPHMQPYLWWKRYLTKLQLVQFVSVMVHSFINYLQKDCKYPSGHSIGFLCYAFIMLILFSNFYEKSYVKSEKKTNSSVDLNNNELKKEK